MWFSNRFRLKSWKHCYLSIGTPCLLTDDLGSISIKKHTTSSANLRALRVGQKWVMYRRNGDLYILYWNLNGVDFGQSRLYFDGRAQNLVFYRIKISSACGRISNSYVQKPRPKCTRTCMFRNARGVCDFTLVVRVTRYLSNIWTYIHSDKPHKVNIHVCCQPLVTYIQSDQPARP